jgi:MFS family permease
LTDDPSPGGARPGGPGRVRRAFLDITPLRLDRDFRWVWSGQAINGIGNQITRLALPYQVYVLTGSPLAIAALTLAQLVPMLALALFAGSLADAVDRRRLLLLTQLGLALSSLSLFALALLPSPPLVLILLVALVAAGFGAVDQPTRASALPRLVPHTRLPAAISLNQANLQTASVVGPAVGGLLIATVGVAGAYLVDVLTFTASLAAVWAISPIRPLGDVRRPGLAAIREGLAFARSRRVLLSTFAIDLNAMIFGMPTALFPVLALDVFRVGPTGLGILAAAPAAGALVGALVSGWVARVRQVGRAVVLAVVVWGAAITGFGLSAFGPAPIAFPIALVFLAIAGAADVQSALFRNLIVQFETPDSLRGRITSIHVMSVTSGPRIGDIEAASVAAVVGAAWSALSGGLLCIIGTAAVARRFPELWRHELPERPAS